MIAPDLDAEAAVLGYMLLHPTRADEIQRTVSPEDFNHPMHAALFAAFDPQTTTQAMVAASGIPPHMVTEAIAAAAMHSTVGRSVSRLLDLSDRRRIAAAGLEVAEIANDPQRPLEDATGLLSETLEDTTPRDSSPPPTGEEFLAGEDDPFDWLIPGLIERGERVLVTAVEGGGKSVLLRQIAVGCATGRHPLFQTQEITPAKVLLVDLENSTRQVRRHLRPLRTAAGAELTNLHVEIRSSGLDLMRRADSQWLLSKVHSTKPDLLVIGPLYRMFASAAKGDIGGENQARQITAVLDRCRALSGCAVMLETHAPHAGQGVRDLRPFGSSVWLRWPEYGIGLAADPEQPDAANVIHWRGPRDERNWPQKLTRGGRWPWTGYYPEGFKPPT